MCRIFAFLNLDGQQQDVLSEEVLSHSLEIIKYSGSNYSGYKSFSSENRLNVFLGHNSADLSSEGSRPFVLQEKYHIVYDGEIYNYIELRKSLEEKGYVFKTKLDVELLLTLYIDSGTSRFHELNGVWAFVIYDEHKKIAVVSRDRFGVKPLYYMKQNGHIFFASEIKQINIHNKKIEVNETALSNYLYSYLLDYDENTFYRNVFQCPPKHSMIIDLKTKEIKMQQYWDFSSQDLSRVSEEELTHNFRELLISSIQLLQRGDTGAVNSLSGGLDSSSIAVLADKFLEKPLINYSIIGNDKTVYEEKYIDYLINKNGISVKKINFDEIDPWLDAEEVIYHHDEPILSLSTIAHFKLLQKIKEEDNIKVVLNGQGGDELLAGYNKYYYFNIKDLFAQGKYIVTLKEMVYLLSKFTDEFQWNYAKRYISNKSRLDEYLTIKRSEINLIGARNLMQKQQEDIAKYSVPAICHYEDRNSMANSLKIRLPFLDYRLVNFSLNLPSNMKIRNGRNKYILRKAIFELPDEIRNRFDKKGFTVNEKLKSDTVYVDMLQNYFKDSILAQLGFVDEQKILKEIELLRRGKGKLWERELHRLLFAEIWVKKIFG